MTGTVLALMSVPLWAGSPWQEGVHFGFSFVCHQLPERSPALFGHLLPVCDRCAGIYLGLLGGALAFPLLWRADGWLYDRMPWTLLASLVPLGVDWWLGYTGLWANTPASRLLTGAVFGLMAGYLLARALSAPRGVPQPAPAAG